MGALFQSGISLRIEGSNGGFDDHFPLHVCTSWIQQGHQEMVELIELLVCCARLFECWIIFYLLQCRKHCPRLGSIYGWRIESEFSPRSKVLCSICVWRPLPITPVDVARTPGDCGARRAPPQLCAEWVINGRTSNLVCWYWRSSSIALSWPLSKVCSWFQTFL